MKFQFINPFLLNRKTFGNPIVKLSFLLFSLFMLIQNNSFGQYLIPVREGFKWGFADTTKKIIIPIKYDEVFPFINGRARVRKKNKWGIIDPNGKWVIPAKQDTITQHRKNPNFFHVMNVKKSIIFSRDGKNILESEGFIYFSEISSKVGAFNDTNSETKGYGLVNDNGGIIVSPTYSFFVKINSKYIKSRKDKKVGVFDFFGNEIFPTTYNVIQVLKNERWLVNGEIKGKENQDGSKYNILDGQKNILNDVPFDKVKKVDKKYGNFLKVERNKKYSLYDFDGNNILPGFYSKVKILSENIILVKDWKQRILLFDFNGKKINSPALDQVYKGSSSLALHDGLFMVRTDRKSGILSEDGRIIISQKYDEIIGDKNFFEDELFIFKKKYLMGVGDKEENVLIDPIYNQLIRGPLKTFIAHNQKYEHGLLNYDGTELIPFGKWRISSLGTAYYRQKTNYLKFSEVKKEGKSVYGVANIKGEVIVSPKYHTIIKKDEYFIVSLEQSNNEKIKHYGVLDIEGNELIDPSKNKIRKVNVLPNGHFEIKEYNPKSGYTDIGKIGYFDSTGIFKIELEGTIHKSFKHDGNFIIKNSSNKTYSLVDSNFQLIILDTLQKISYKEEFEMYFGTSENKFHVVNSKGDEMFPSINEYVHPYKYNSNDLFYRVIINKIIVGYLDKNRKPYFLQDDKKLYLKHFFNKKRLEAKAKRVCKISERIKKKR